MFQDGYERLQSLQRQKENFLKLKQTHKRAKNLEKQESKYHQYILTQMTYKDKLNSAFCMQKVIASRIVALYNVFFKKISSHKVLSSEVNKSSNCGKEKFYQRSPAQEKQLKMNSKVRNSSAVAIRCISRCLQSVVSCNVRSALDKITKHDAALRKGQNVAKIINRISVSQIREPFYRIKFSTRGHQKMKRLQTQLVDQQDRVVAKEAERSFILSLNEFSQILPYTILEESKESQNSLSQSSLTRSQMLQNEPFPDRTAQSGSNQEFQKLMESAQKLKSEVLSMKLALDQKNAIISQKDQQIVSIRSEYEEKIQKLHDEISEKIEANMSLGESQIRFSSHKSGHSQYLKQLSNALIGDRGTCLQYDGAESNEPVNEQLLQKYMRESFELREKMDMARELCEEFDFNPREEEGQIMLEIIGLLTPVERLNVQVD